MMEKVVFDCVIAARAEIKRNPISIEEFVILDDVIGLIGPFVPEPSRRRRAALENHSRIVELRNVMKMWGYCLILQRLMVGVGLI